MKTITLMLVIVCLLVSPSLDAKESDSVDRQAISAVFDALTSAWRAGDGEAWGDQFVDDADFTVWFGLELKGKNDIASGHQFVFDKVYPGTAFELEIRQLRFLGSDFAVAHLTGFVVTEGEAVPEGPDAVPIAIVQRVEEEWKIVAFHNTPFIVPELRQSMPLAKFKKLVAEQTKEP